MEQREGGQGHGLWGGKQSTQQRLDGGAPSPPLLAALTYDLDSRYPSVPENDRHLGLEGTIGSSAAPPATQRPLPSPCSHLPEEIQHGS